MIVSDLASYLTTAGEPWPVYFDEPNDPDNLVVLSEYAGRAPLATHEDALAVERPQVQVLYRSLDMELCRARIEFAYRLLGRVSNQVLGTTFYQQLRAVQAPFALGRDDSDRARYVFNLAVDKSLG